MSKKKGNSPKYSPEFKIIVVEDMLKNKLGYVKPHANTRCILLPNADLGVMGIRFPAVSPRL